MTMTKSQIIKKAAFTVLGLGTTLSGDYQELPSQKRAFWQTVHEDGRFTSLMTLAQNQQQFAVNEAIDGKMFFYAGVQTDANVSVGETQRAISFPASDYLVVTGEAASETALFELLEGQSFGEVLPSLSGYAYVGGPNATVITTHQDNQVQGEMWIPIVTK